jgi:pyruvate/2-oxoglutarate dehydrogenase complex dihydrolipoamide dehydrogenase (E3) component
MKHYDAIVIGTGQAGPSAAVRMAEQGWKVAVIERKLFGGTCVNTGCTPTKAYVGSARRAYLSRNSQHMGISIEGRVDIDLKRIKNRKDEIVMASRTGLESWLEGMDGVDVYRGHGVFTEKKKIKVGETELSADRILINVGGRARIPDGFDSVPYLTNTSILELEEIPEHLIVVGGGYIGLEFAQVFRRFGSEVTVIEMSGKLLRREDDDVSDTIREILESEGIRIRYNAECLRAEPRGDQVKVEIDCSSGDREIIGSHLLLATGRIPNTDELGLDAAGISMNSRGFIEVDDALQTSISGVYALGDCNGRGAFTHTAYNDFQIIESQFFGDKSRKLSSRIPCYGLFIDPPLGRVGLSEKEAREKGISYKIGRRKMAHVSRAKEFGETRGFMKVLVEEGTEKILGAAFIGLGGDENIHTVIDQMYAGQSYKVIRDAIHIHPTVSELIPTLLEKLS